jgi:DsbC/DsbD-like thiol-disulfide interchange protein
VHRRCIVLTVLAAGLAAPVCAARPRFIDVELISESLVPRPGQTILVGLQMNPKPGWHGYWSNPGEGGLAPVVKWSGPPGVHFGPLQHPAPSLLRVMGLTSYVHAGPHLLLARITLDRKAQPGMVLPITADVTLAACSDSVCVPEKARLSLRMTVGSGTPSAQAPRLRRALAKQPRRAGPGSFVVRGRQIILNLPASARISATSARFFPDANGYWDPLRARVVPGRPLRIVSPVVGKPPNRLTGVVSDGSSAYRIDFERSR